MVWRRRSRAGASLIEFIAVLSVISVCIFLMIPAILNARRAASRSQCLNNLKQVTLALQNYQESHISLPPGVVNLIGPIQSGPPKGIYGQWVIHTGWLVSLLPYIEQRLLSQEVDTDVSIFDETNLSIRLTQVNSFVCPNDPLLQYHNTLTGPLPATVTPGRPVVSSYAGCHHDVEAPIDRHNRGVLYLNSHIRQQDVYDGTSSTIYVSEKRAGINDLGWAVGDRSTLRNTGTPLNATPPGPEIAGLPTYVGGFSSYHPGGVNAAFGDGSVRFLRDSIDPKVLQWLGNRDDGEMIEP